MTETIESTETETKSPIRFDPFENPGPLAVEEADWLNNEFPGLNITPGHVRAVISNHSRFQKSDSRVANRTKENEERAVEREARKARHQERLRLAAERKAEREARAAEKAAAKAAKDAEAAAKAESSTAAGDSGEEAQKKVRKPRPSKAQVSPEAQDTF